MLPGGFVDGAEQGSKGRASGPVVEEMVERTQDSYGKDGREIPPVCMFEDVCIHKYLREKRRDFERLAALASIYASRREKILKK